MSATKTLLFSIIINILVNSSIIFCEKIQRAWLLLRVTDTLYRIYMPTLWIFHSHGVTFLMHCIGAVFLFHKTQHVCILRCVATIQVKAHKHCNKSCPGLFLMPDVEICGLPFLWVSCQTVFSSKYPHACMIRTENCLMLSLYQQWPNPTTPL